jgi:hypothetical protein
MTGTRIAWYSINRNLAVEEHEPVPLDEALKIADRYLACAGKQYESAEEAIAATMFGFSRSASDFIEFCVNGPDDILYKLEMARPNASWFRRFFCGPLQHEERLTCREDLVQKVRAFFETSDYDKLVPSEAE